MTSAIETLSRWSEQSVPLETVLAALEGLRRPEPMPATRTSVLTLCIVGEDRDRVEHARDAVHELGGRHPARVLHLVLDPDNRDGPPGLDASIHLLGGEASGRELWFEDVDLVVHGPATAHLDSILEPLTLPDLPVVAWFVDAPPAPSDPLVDVADAVLVDSRELGGLDCFTALQAIVAARPVVDLSWVRLEPWRVLLAGLFEGPDFRPFVHHVRHAVVAGRTGPRHLVGGWLLDRLGLPRAALHLEPDEHVAIRLVAELPDTATQGIFEAARGDPRRVEARARIEGGPLASAVLELPEATPAWGLADALSRLERDEIYESALGRALS
jgi:glucose-6-phosphate dehydrogenase assembly protein OpcA